MARSCIPLLTNPRSVPAAGGIDLCVATSRLRFQTLEDGPPDDVSMSTVLLNFSTLPMDRHWSEAAGRGFAAARVARRTLRLDQLSRSLEDALATHAGAEAGMVAVVALPPVAEIPLDTVQQAIDVMRATQTCAEVVVAVSNAPEGWKALRDVDGYVPAFRHQLGQTSAVLFRALATLMAPEALNCFGLDELLQVFGGPSREAHLAQAIWLREQGQLCLPSRADAELLQHSDTVIAFHHAETPDLAAVRGVSSSLRDMAPAGADVATNVTSGLWEPTACEWPAGASPVALLCRRRT